MNEVEFIELINTNRRLIMKICYIYAKDSDECKDLFQEGVLNLWKSVDNFRAESKLGTWLYRVTLNSCISYRRNQKKSVYASSIIEISEGYFKNDESSNFEELYSLISQLNPLDKAIVLLHLEERCYDDISEIIGVSTSNVGVRLNRIRKKLKSMYKKQK